MPRVIHFEISADQPERVSKFYQDVFDWKIKKWEGPVDYWLITTGEGQPGIDGAIKRRVSDTGVVNTIEVPSIEAYFKKIIESGGKVVKPKLPIPGVGYHAYCQDTEGNIFGLMENDPSAR